MRSARAKKKRPYHHGDLRRALLDATLQLAAERGAAGVTLREAARVAGVSQTAPYRHFVDKQAMLAAAAAEGFGLLRRDMERALAASASAGKGQTLAAGSTYVRFALEHTPHFRLMFGHGSPPKSASSELQQAARAVYQIFLGAIVREQGQPARARSVRESFFRTWALAHGIATLALERQILFDLPPEALIRAARAAFYPT